MAEKRQFPTPEMIAAEEKLAKKTPEERAADEKIMRDELRRYYERRISAESQRALLGLEE